MGKKKAVTATIIGNALEYYDITLYGYYAAFLAPFFFPSENPSISLMSSFGAFAAGFVMRPLGGIFFGNFGDRIGRRQALLLTIVLMTIPTFMIGLLPTYGQIGVLAPIILVLCRLLQGFCAGGEFGGAVVLINEHSGGVRRGFLGSLLAMSGFLGAVLGTALGAIFTLSIWPDWAWRIPFLIGGVLGIVAYFLRSSLEESPEFIKTKAEREIVKFPLLKALGSYPLNSLCTFGIGAAAVIPFYTLSIYTNSILTQDLHFTPSQSMSISCAVMIFWAVLLPVFGDVADKIGRTRLMSAASILTVIVAFPAFWIVYSGEISLFKVIFMQVLLSLVGIMFVAPVPSLLPNLFPTGERYSGVAFSYQLGAALLGGTTPFIASVLVAYTGFKMSPAFYVVVSGFIGLVSATMARDLSQVERAPTNLNAASSI